ncbi:MAG TPA: ion transporter [Aliidongia sp.]|uniref:ion transporter n=1 Tax=Aliidongia sp. TaxID=1914230 RepID=UPI002DDDA435|nr:ion transporter [Aliidongia sp.]HEV2678353.1 ion transporter [Aliidongia sp.]
MTTLRQQVNALFDHDLPSNLGGRLISGFVGLLIIVNVFSVVLESVESLRVKHFETFWWIEQVSTAVFAIEYLLRVWSAPDRVSGRFRAPLAGRLRYASRPFALVDLIAILPAILGMLGADDLRVLRLLRLLRMLKLTRHSTAFTMVWDVFREEAQSIGAVLFILVITLIMSGSIMYMLEGDAQPEVFSSIPAAIWWALVTLTTVGYGDMVPVTVWGKLFGGLVAIVGVCTLALFSGLLTVSFMDQLRMRREQYRSLLRTGMASGQMHQRDAQAMEKLGTNLGVPRRDAEAMVDQALAGGPCPHCGQAMPHDAQTAK